MYNDVVKPLIKKGKDEETKIFNLKKQLETITKDFKLLNLCARHPVVAEHLQRACKRHIHKDGNKKIEKKVITNLKKAGFYDLAKEPIDKFAKKLNFYLVKTKDQPYKLTNEDE